MSKRTAVICTKNFPLALGSKVYSTEPQSGEGSPLDAAVSIALTQLGTVIALSLSHEFANFIKKFVYFLTHRQDILSLLEKRRRFLYGNPPAFLYTKWAKCPKEF